MSTTFTIDSATSRATPVPAPMKRVTVPAVRARKPAIADGGEPLVMLTAYTVRMAQLLDPHCDLLLVGDSLGQVIYGLPSTVPVTLDMMAAHGAAVVRGSHHALVVIDMPFGSYEASPQQAFESAARLLKDTGAAAVKLEGGVAMAPTVAFLSERGIPVMGHVGLTPQAVNALGGYGARGRSEAEAAKIVADARAVADAGAFALVIEGVVEPIAIEITRAVACPTIGIGASAQCDGQVLVAEDMLGLFERDRTVRETLRRHGRACVACCRNLCRRRPVARLSHGRSALRAALAGVGAGMGRLRRSFPPPPPSLRVAANLFPSFIRSSPLAVTPADQDAAFLREVDENLRADQLAAFGRKWGKIILAAVVLGLVILAAFLWWQHHQRVVAGEQGEALQKAYEDIGAGRIPAAEKPIAELAVSRIDGYRAAALLTQAAVAVERKDDKTAIAKLGAVAGDTSLAQPYRDLALVKQTMLQFDTLPPQTVIDRLKPLAITGNAFFGAAGEMTALAQLRLGRRGPAGQMFAAVAKDDGVPGSIRQRAVQMAGVLGVDAVQQPGGGNTNAQRASGTNK